MNTYWGIAALLTASFLVDQCQAWAPSTTIRKGLATPGAPLSPPHKYDQLALSKVRIPSSLYASVAEELTSETEGDKQKDSNKPKQAPTKSAAKGRRFDDPVPYSELTIGILKETYPGENRVSQTPDSVKTLTKAGFNVIVQSGGVYMLYFGIHECLHPHK
jgi:hypothetical protein